ncbi:MAG TPA: hypothetical protein VE177_00175 [Candidatus Binatus sp.]|nr:hypothetical protein [Candidatus Binatus sp.]
MRPSPPGSSVPGQKPSKPTGVTVIGVIAVLGGLLGLFGAIPVLMNTPTSLQAVLGSIVVVFSFLAFGVGAGLIRGLSWAWRFAVVFYAVAIPLGIAEIVLGGSVGLIGGVIRTVVGLVFLYYLMRPSVKSFFGRM